METSMVAFVKLLASSFIVEAVVFTVFAVKEVNAFDKKITRVPMKVIFAMILGVVFCFQLDIDLLHAIFNVDSTWFGYIVTGLLISRGSNYMHDLIGNLKELGREKKGE